MCNYAGYRDALESNNWTYYYASTRFGSLGNISKCLETDKRIITEGERSFPSGHASLSFQNFGLAGLLFLQLAQIRFRSHRFGQGVVVMVMFAAACIVATTRTRDNWHNYDDILAGAVIGSACSAFSFTLHYFDAIVIIAKESQRHVFIKKDIVPPPNSNVPPVKEEVVGDVLDDEVVDTSTS